MAVPEFDQIAPMYDETRRPLDEKTVDGIKEMFSKHDCETILEIGVGTGRVSAPLARSGFQMTGVDISRKMMERAQAKGLENLVLASGYAVPFSNRKFDATVMAHVFHLLEEPMSVLREAARVSKVGVFALVRRGGFRREGWGLFWGPDRSSFPGHSDSGIDSSSSSSSSSLDEPTSKYYEDLRRNFREIALKYHWTPDQRRPRNWQWEQDLLDKYPPDDLKVVIDELLNESFEARLERLEKGAFSSVSSMPEEMRKELVAQMRKSAEKFPPQIAQPRRESYQLVMWKPETFRS